LRSLIISGMGEVGVSIGVSAIVLVVERGSRSSTCAPQCAEASCSAGRGRSVDGEDEKH
jgi:hypothetical protein